MPISWRTLGAILVFSQELTVCLQKSQPTIFPHIFTHLRRVDHLKSVLKIFQKILVYCELLSSHTKSFIDDEPWP